MVVHRLRLSTIVLSGRPAERPATRMRRERLLDTTQSVVTDARASWQLSLRFPPCCAHSSPAMPLSLSKPAGAGGALRLSARRSRRSRAAASAPTTALLKVSQGWETRVSSWTQTDRHVIVKLLLGSTIHPSGERPGDVELKLVTWLPTSTELLTRFNGSHSQTSRARCGRTRCS